MAEAPEAEPMPMPGGPAFMVQEDPGGQSGSEGGSAKSPLPCLDPERTVVRLRVTALEGRCMEGEVLSLESDGARASGLEEGDAVGGSYFTLATSAMPSVGDTVLAIHAVADPQDDVCEALLDCWSERCDTLLPEGTPSPCHDECTRETADVCPSGSRVTLAVVVMQDDRVVVEWDGATHRLTVAETLADDCVERFRAGDYASPDLALADAATSEPTTSGPAQGGPVPEEEQPCPSF